MRERRLTDTVRVLLRRELLVPSKVVQGLQAVERRRGGAVGEVGLLEGSSESDGSNLGERARVGSSNGLGGAIDGDRGDDSVSLDGRDGVTVRSDVGVVAVVSVSEGGSETEGRGTDK